MTWTLPAPSTAAALALCAGALLSACGSSPPPPPYLHLAPDDQLPGPWPQAAAPGPAGGLPLASATARAATQAWRLLPPVSLPAALDREAVMVATAPGQWVHWQGLRWSEPLRDALPRVLATELSAARGAPVWSARAWPDAPSGAAMPRPRSLRVAVLGWEASLPQAAVLLSAQWQLGPEEGVGARAGSGAAQGPGQKEGQVLGPLQSPLQGQFQAQPQDPAQGLLQGQVQVRVPWPDATPAGLVQAQRQALKALAQGLVADVARTSLAQPRAQP